MSRRHWKQRWDPSASFVFTRRMKLGLDPKNPWVYPGDDVPTGDLRLGRGRLRKWWDSEIIAIKGWKPGGQALHPAIDDAKAQAAELEASAGSVTTETTEPRAGPVIEATPEGFDVFLPSGEVAAVETTEEAVTFIKTGELPADVPEVVVEENGGGWFTVTVPGEAEPRKVQGKEALDALLVELDAAPVE